MKMALIKQWESLVHRRKVSHAWHYFVKPYARKQPIFCRVTYFIQLTNARGRHKRFIQVSARTQVCANSFLFTRTLRNGLLTETVVYAATADTFTTRLVYLPNMLWHKPHIPIAQYWRKDLMVCVLSWRQRVGYDCLCAYVRLCLRAHVRLRHIFTHL